MSECKSCKAEIKWVTMISGKKMPLDARPIKVIVVDDDDTGTFTNAYISHLATCPHSSKFRKRIYGKPMRVK